MPGTSGGHGKKKPGDPLAFPAAAYNDFVDAARWVKENGALAAGGTSRAMSGAFTSRPGLVKVRNASGGILPQFSVVGLRDIVFDPAVPDELEEFKRYPAVFSVARPTCDHVGKFGVLIEPLADGEVGFAVVSGVVQVQVEIEEEAHNWADITPLDETKLTTVDGVGSAQILYKESGVGLKWAVVRISNSLSADSCVSTSTTQPPTTTGTTAPPTTTGTTGTQPPTTTGTTGTGTTGTQPPTTTGTTGTGTTGTGTTGTQPPTTTGTTGTGTTGTGTTGTGTTGTGTTGTGTTGTGGTGTTGTGTTGTGTTGGTGTTAPPCPPYSCGGDCMVSLEVVTDVRCENGEIVLDKATICLSSGAVDLG